MSDELAALEERFYREVSEALVVRMQGTGNGGLGRLAKQVEGEAVAIGFEKQAIGECLAAGVEMAAGGGLGAASCCE